MALLLRNIVLLPGEPDEKLRSVAAGKLRLRTADVLSCTLVRKGLDARKKGGAKFVCTVRLEVKDEGRVLQSRRDDPDLSRATDEQPPQYAKVQRPPSVVVIGTGPAGLFAALRLTEYGIAPLIVERGKPVRERLADVQALWSRGILDPDSNVQFGEGGAGTFSDGKLTSRTRAPEMDYVFERLVSFGAPQEILYLAKPHIGTDRLRSVVQGIRMHLLDRGCTILFGTRVSDLLRQDEGRVRGIVTEDGREFLADHVVLAPGNASRDTYRMLHRQGVALQAKAFAVGFRVEHPQELIDEIQYGRNRHPALPPAEYAVTHTNPVTGRSAYSFCMCPGGAVVAATSHAGGVVTNGMSLYRRNAPCANSALVVSVKPEDFPGEGPLATMMVQEEWEERAFAAAGGGYRAPAQNLEGFFRGKGGLPLRSSYRPGVTEADLSRLYPPFVGETLREALPFIDRRMRGFLTAEATLTGVETRTSAPVRIVRGEDFQSVSVRGLYPAGEGAGYAGGIVSAAVDGIRVADAIAAALNRGAV